MLVLILVAFNPPNLSQSSLNMKRKTEEGFSSSTYPNILKSNTNQRHSQLFNSMLTSSHSPSYEPKNLPEKSKSSISYQPLPIDDRFSTNVLSTEKVINSNITEERDELSNTSSVDFQPSDSSSSTLHHLQSSSSIIPPFQSEEIESSHPPTPSTTSTLVDFPINLTSSSSSSSHRRWIPTRPSHLGSLDVWKEYLRKYRSTHIKLSKTSQKVMYLKRGTTGIAGQMIGVCDSLLIAMMTNRGLQCRLA